MLKVVVTAGVKLFGLEYICSKETDQQFVLSEEFGVSSVLVGCSRDSCDHKLL